MYYFPQFPHGTAFATMELLDSEGSGLLPSRIGTYELLALTKLDWTNPPTAAFSSIDRRMCGLLTAIARYSEIASLNPNETCEVPADGDGPNASIIFAAHPTASSFQIGMQVHGLLLCIEVHAVELEFARQQGTQALIRLLRASGHFPYSDLDRPAVVS
jgi:hypothetical protein